MRLKLILLTTTLFLSACFPTSFEAVKPNGDKFEVLFYPGGEVIDDLLIIEEQNYFGTAPLQYRKQGLKKHMFERRKIVDTELKIRKDISVTPTLENVAAVIRSAPAFFKVRICSEW